MITRRGVGIILTAVGIFFLASITRVGWLHLTDAVLWGMIAVGLVLPWITVPGLKANRKIDTGRTRDEVAPIVGDEIDVQVDIANHGVVPRYLVTASYESSFSGIDKKRERVFFTHLPGGTTTTGANTVTCDLRGLHEIGSLTVESAAPFGLFRRKKRVAAPFEVLVYPKWHQMSHVGLLEAPRGETEGRRVSRTGNEVMAARRYGVGDPMRDIHWKNTARTGRLMVKEYDAGADDGVVIALDASSVHGEGAKTTLEYALSIAASASRALVRNNHEVSIAAGGIPGPATTDWAKIMESLALVETGPLKKLGNAIANVPGTARVLAIVSADDRVSVKALASLALRGGSVSAVVLGGFTDSDHTTAAVASLKATGVSAIECQRGHIEDCISEIEAGEPTHADVNARRWNTADAPNIGDLGRAA
ncbi:MAG: DUF58 domain-containing protein [Chloroflexi bacterium]|jgi:uncharacterized protein (DUF58 family)|nr:DUF58 domain-containing protein [Chloroflexota bacterium]MBT4074460.1 DUF58 domain-containing protein [Chloroflexota bacterium]MBT4515824.1 DUF58 domain-containing protein [Chloroflexota bacterium]MBT5318293.1 DUF58 domain-containing protein [Chloroflexota bacterium]MBT6680553.1 DUF58 domain-containing protein [Chloroflexota bacterium]